MWLWWVRRRDLGRSLFAAVFPEFIAREKPGQRGTGCQGSKRRVGAARSRRRGLGPARLDSQTLRATVAEKSDGLGERRTAADGPGDALKPTPRGERHCVPQARLTGSKQSAWRAIDVVCWPIRRSLVGGPVGRQACAAGWAHADPWRANAVRRRQPTAGRERWMPERGETLWRLDATHDSAARPYREGDAMTIQAGLPN